jgi:hypothetical protein
VGVKVSPKSLVVFAFKFERIAPNTFLSKPRFARRKIWPSEEACTERADRESKRGAAETPASGTHASVTEDSEEWRFVKGNNRVPKTAPA